MLKKGLKTGNDYFSVYLGDGGGRARLFTANIAKKSVKRSVDRNLYKRRIRAVFAKHKRLFTGMDVLIMPRPGLAKLKTFREIEDSLTPLFPGGAK